MLSTLVLAIALGSLSAASQEKSPDLDVVARMVFEQTNRFRTGERRSELRPNVQLAAAARDLAEFMANTDKFGHDADGSQPPDRAKKHGYDYCLIAENIAYYERTAGIPADELAGALVEVWKKSPPHRKNMLDPDALEVGNAVAHSAKSGKYYAVQVLGRPSSAAIEFQIDNQSDAEAKYQIGDESMSIPPRLVRTHRQCRSDELKFLSNDATGGLQVFRPVSGDRFVITRKEGKTEVTRKFAKDGQPAGTVVP
jgi:uncharacterized protein YkwD